ncbi:MAG: hypothetical protein Q3980_13060 [Turicibacter sp.]|nr:hypothetical protein [Turicibacter sp.]
MKKIALFVGIVVVVLGCYFISIYSFSLNEKVVGSIEIRKNGVERIELSEEEASYLVSELNDLKFKIFNEDLEITTDAAGYKGPQKKFRVFVFDKNGNELADIRVYDEKNISYVKKFDGSFSLGYHATNGVLDLEKLSSLSE